MRRDDTRVVPPGISPTALTSARRSLAERDLRWQHDLPWHSHTPRTSSGFVQFYTWSLLFGVALVLLPCGYLVSLVTAPGSVSGGCFCCLWLPVSS